MFIKTSSESDFYSNLQDNLGKSVNSFEDYKSNRDKLAINYLKVAADLLYEAGLQDIAKKIAVVVYSMEDLEIRDSATDGLTSEKMVENLKNRGWVFNAVDDEDLESEEELSISLED